MYLLIFGQLFVGSYPPDFRNLSGHRCTKPRHYVKVADHGGDSDHYIENRILLSVASNAALSCFVIPSSIQQLITSCLMLSVFYLAVG